MQQLSFRHAGFLRFGIGENAGRLAVGLVAIDAAALRLRGAQRVDVEHLGLHPRRRREGRDCCAMPVQSGQRAPRFRPGATRPPWRFPRFRYERILNATWQEQKPTEKARRGLSRNWQ